MAESEATLCSSALTLLGAEPITSLNEVNDRAILCARHYPDSRDEMLARVPWKCARARVALALSANAPLFNWPAKFALPSDCIWVWRTSLDIPEGGDGTPWNIEGNFLVTSVSVLNALYIFRLTDTKAFDPLLAKAIMYDLAAKLTFPITQSISSQQMWEGLREKTLKSAGAKNGQFGSKESYISTTLTTQVR